MGDPKQRVIRFPLGPIIGIVAPLESRAVSPETPTGEN